VQLPGQLPAPINLSLRLLFVNRYIDPARILYNLAAFWRYHSRITAECKIVRTLGASEHEVVEKATKIINAWHNDACF
jgi:hypothetical protein